MKTISRLLVVAITAGLVLTPHIYCGRVLVEAGAKDGERWAELMRNVDTQRKLAESDRKRRVEEHQVATTEEILAIMGAVLAIICRHVTDSRIRGAIGTDIDGLVGGNGSERN